MDLEYKNVKEQFVSDLSGTSAEEVLFLSCITLLASFTLSLGRFVLCKHVPSLKSQHLWYIIALELALVISPILLFSTILSNYLKYAIPVYVIILFVLKLYVENYGLHQKNFNIRINESDKTGLQFLTNFRSHLLFDTVVSILAVDFPFYPRRYAKTELFGWGYMDAGVGSFIVAGGLVAKEARQTYEVPSSTISVAIRELVHSLPVCVIGVSRALIVELVNYQKHTSEYGSHWNFFLTIAFTRVIGALIKQMQKSTLSTVITAFILILLYQLCLNLGLTDFIVNSERDNLITANKEGLISLFGYVSLYLFAMSLGRIIHQNMANVTHHWKYPIWLFTLGLSTHLLMYGVHFHIQPVSRRLVNLGYILWMISLSSFHLAFHLIFHYSTDSSINILKAINFNGLFFFLLANVLTGLINLSIKTVYTNNSAALLILYLYLFFLCGTVMWLYHKSIVIKIPHINRKIKK